MHTNKPKIFFFIPDFNGGGAERNLINLLNYWATQSDKQWEFELVVRSKKGYFEDALSPNITLHTLNLTRTGYKTSIQTMLKLASLIATHRPHAIVSYLSYPSVALATKLSRVPCKIVASIQNPVLATAADPSTPSLLRSRFAIWINKQLLHQADLLLPIAPGICEELLVKLNLPKSRVHILPNSVNIKGIQAAIENNIDHPFFTEKGIPVFITACRLVQQKRVDILIQAFKQASQRTACRLLILGEGDQMAELKALTQTLGLQETVNFVGFQSNIWDWMAQADIFVLSSEYEGFGNVIVESMAIGLPVITTQAPFGPQYIIENNSQGILVPVNAPTEFANNMVDLINTPSRQRDLSKNGLKRAADFDISTTYAQFNNLLESILCA